MKSILIIDDDVISRTVVERLLRKAGYTTLVADNGDEGVRLYERRPADLIITDIFMPEQNGFEVIQKLLAKDPGLKIIAMSGSFMPRSNEDRALRETLGVLKTFSKPLDPDALLETVYQALQGADERKRQTPPTAT